jgi:uncharacterized protein DUF3574
LAGCGHSSNQRAACALPGEQPFTKIELYFGEDIPGRGPLTDAEWSDFVERVISQQFPDGFTIVEGDGQWLDQRTGNTVHEKSKVFIAAADPESNLARRIGAVVDAYKRQFRQQSVGIMTSPVCGAF